MENHWAESRAGAVAADDDGVEYFAEQPFPLLGDTVLGDLNSLCLLTLQGPDARKFLQGQLTQDVSLLEQGWAPLADHCNPKGRVIASLRLCADGPERALLCLPRDNAQALAASLGKYLVFAKAKLLREPHWQLLYLSGPRALQLAQTAGLPLPPEVGRVAEFAAGKIIRTGAQSLELWLPQPEAVRLWWQWRGECVPAGRRLWLVEQIRQGIAWVFGAGRELFTPHQLNHPLVGAVHFKKGCYTGQEVVARMHYKGNLKSHGYRFTAGALPRQPQPGDALFSGDAKVGELIMAAQSGPDSWELLANVRDDALHAKLHLGTAPAGDLAPALLPYAIG